MARNDGSVDSILFSWACEECHSTRPTEQTLHLEDKLLVIGDFHRASADLEKKANIIYVGDEDPAEAEKNGFTENLIIYLPGNHDTEWPTSPKEAWRYVAREVISENAKIEGPFSIKYGKYLIIPVPGVTKRKNGSPPFETFFRNSNGLYAWLDKNLEYAKNNNLEPVVITHEPIYPPIGKATTKLLDNSQISMIKDYLRNRNREHEIEENPLEATTTAENTRDGIYLAIEGSVRENSIQNLTTVLYRKEGENWYRAENGEWKESKMPERAVWLDDIVGVYKIEKENPGGKKETYDSLLVSSLLLQRLRSLALSIDGHRISVNIARGEKMKKTTRFYDPGNQAEGSVLKKKAGKKKGYWNEKQYGKDRFAPVDDLYVEVLAETAKMEGKAIYEMLNKLAERHGIMVHVMHGHIHSIHAMRIVNGNVVNYDCSVNPHYKNGEQETYMITPTKITSYKISVN